MTFTLRYLTYFQKANPGGSDEAHAVADLGSLAHRRGDYGEALEHARRSLEISRKVNDVIGEGDTLHAMAQGLNALGRSEEAMHGATRSAADPAASSASGLAEAETLLQMASVERDRGDLREALRAGRGRGRR